MYPFFFGESGRQLFGVYHAPYSHPKALAVLLCQPLHGEYIQSHRAVRALARMLAREGVPALRFDYYGTGDSAGASEETNLSRCWDDIAIAARELKDTSGASRLVLIGLRLGGALAASMAARIEGVHSLVLWDPVVDGSEYLEALALKYEKFSRTRRYTPNTPEESHRYGGYPLSDQLRAELRALKVVEMDLRAGQRILLASTEGDASYEEVLRRLRGSAAEVEHATVPGQRIWEARLLESNELVPTAMLRTIVSWVLPK